MGLLAVCTVVMSIDFGVRLESRFCHLLGELTSPRLGFLLCKMAWSEHSVCADSVIFLHLDAIHLPVAPKGTLK